MKTALIWVVATIVPFGYVALAVAALWAHRARRVPAVAR